MSTTIVLLPGLDGTGALFRPFLPHLPPELRPIVVAYPGEEPLGYDALLPLVIEALPGNEPFVILGESFSGPLALMAAATRPHGLRAIVLCATFVQNPLWIRVAWLRHIVRPFAFRLYPAFSKAKALFSAYSTPELRASITQALSAVRPEVLAHRVRSVMQVNVAAELLRCPVPILYLRGTRDLIVLGHNARKITAINPQVRVVAIEAPHMVLQTRPAAAAASIASFVEETPVSN